MEEEEEGDDVHFVGYSWEVSEMEGTAQASKQTRTHANKQTNQANNRRFDPRTRAIRN